MNNSKLSDRKPNALPNASISQIPIVVARVFSSQAIPIVSPIFLIKVLPESAASGLGLLGLDDGVSR